MALDMLGDYERIGLAADWANDAASKLVAAQKTGLVRANTGEGQDALDALYDGLMTLAENLGALTLPYPPPPLPAVRREHLRVVK